MDEYHAYGTRYYGVQVTPELSQLGKLYVWADTFDIQWEVLSFYCIETTGQRVCTLALAPGKWSAVYLATRAGLPVVMPEYPMEKVE